RQVARLFGRLISKLRQHTLKSTTHFIPCNLVYDSEPPEFSIGPVHFMKMKQWRSQHTEELKRDKIFPDHEDLLQGLFEYDWIACVTVMPCDSEMSNKRAHFSVEAAINILRLFIPLRTSRQFHTSYGFTIRRQFHGITRTNGKF